MAFFERRWPVLLVVAGMLSAAAPVVAQDVRVPQLESEVRRLQRELDALKRRIDQLERTRPAPGYASPALRKADPASPSWLIAANWERVGTGMKAVEVIALLGLPTSVREDGETRTLMYAMELGPEAVLSGQVVLGRRGVTEVRRPEIR